MSDEFAPSVSVVVPTYNRLERLKRVLAALEAQDYRHDLLEVVVVSDGSTDGTNEYLATLPLVVTAVQANAGPAAARNAGVALASNDYVVFIDDDVIPEPDLVSRHVAAHARHDGPTVVIGPMLTPNDVELSPWVLWEQAMLYKQYDAMDAGEWSATARQFYTGNASLRREHVLAAGGFDPTLRRAEDVEFAIRLSDLGLSFEYEPTAIGYHYAERSYRAWLGNAAEYGRNCVIFARDLGYPWVYDILVQDFAAQHRVVKIATRACLRFPRGGAAFEAVLRGAAQCAGRVFPRQRATHTLLSGVYSIRYYRSIAAEMGRPADLLAILDEGAARE